MLTDFARLPRSRAIQVVVSAAASICPGALFLAVFQPAFFAQIDTAKLFLVAGAISFFAFFGNAIIVSVADTFCGSPPKLRQLLPFAAFNTFVVFSIPVWAHLVTDDGLTFKQAVRLAFKMQGWIVICQCARVIIHEIKRVNREAKAAQSEISKGEPSAPEERAARDETTNGKRAAAA